MSQFEFEENKFKLSNIAFYIGELIFQRHYEELKKGIAIALLTEIYNHQKETLYDGITYILRLKVPSLITTNNEESVFVYGTFSITELVELAQRNIYPDE